MLSTDRRIEELTRALHDVAIEEAPTEVATRIAADARRDIEPPRRLASPALLAVAARHEASHAWAAFSSGWTVMRITLRPDATGSCWVQGYGTDHAASVARITFALAGPASDLRETSAGKLAPSYDLLVSRLQIDAINARAIGPHLSFEQAASTAVHFVDEHAQAIQNIGLALFDARELDHLSVKVFGRSGYDG